MIHPLAGGDRAFAHVGVVVLPQDPGAAGSRLQLPAKLLDAQRFGRPSIATATPPILKLGGPALHPVRDWRDLAEGLSALDRLHQREERERLGRDANQHFNAIVSVEAQAGVLGPALAAVGLEPSTRVRR